MTPSLKPVIIPVRTYELDSFGHVNNSVYLNYLEVARSELLEQVGISFNEFAELQVQLVIVEAKIKYHSPARYGTEIVVTGRFVAVRRASVTIQYTLTDGATGRLIATAETLGAFIDPTTGKPIRSPDRFRDAFLSIAAEAT